jgi:N6-adenosine-specific RNA methylase IME4
MTRLEFHPLANLFPLMEGVEFDALVSDMKANGFRSGEKIVLYEGQILDGRNRYRAAVAAGIILEEANPKEGWLVVEFSGDGIDGVFSEQEIAAGPLAYVLSKNLHRRHLNESQRAMVAARLATMRRGERTDLEPSANLRKVDQSAAAKMLNVSERSVSSAKTIQETGSPALVHAVDTGKIAASVAAAAAKLPPEQQQKVVDEAEAGHANVVRTVVKQGVRANREAALGAKQLAFPDKKYGVILADPEWEFVVYSRTTGLDRSADNHYPTSSAKTIAARDIEKLAAKDCLLALWVTDLARGIRVMESWGFEYKSYFVWVKDIVEIGVVNEDGSTTRIFQEIGPAGTGFWNRDRDEILLIGTRGSVPCPAQGIQGESVIFAARPKEDGADRGRHSAKPPYVHEWLERHYPTMPKIELNARTRRPGWDAWGNELSPELNEFSARLAALTDAAGMVHVNATHIVAAVFVTAEEVAEAEAYAAAVNDDPPNDGDMLGDAGAANEPDGADDDDSEFADTPFNPDRDLPAFLRRPPGAAEDTP